MSGFPEFCHCGLQKKSLNGMDCNGKEAHVLDKKRLGEENYKMVLSTGRWGFGTGPCVFMCVHMCLFQRWHDGK